MSLPETLVESRDGVNCCLLETLAKFFLVFSLLQIQMSRGRRIEKKKRMQNESCSTPEAPVDVNDVLREANVMTFIKREE